MASDKRLDSGIEPEKEQLANKVNGRDPGDIDILGYGVMYTVGADWNCIVPRDWLLDRMNDLGLPMWLAPSETAPHYVYDRAIMWMKEDWLDEYTIEAPRMDTGVEEGHEVQVYLREGDGSRVWHVYAEVFFDEEESKQDGGTWVQHHLGHFIYDKEASTIRARRDDELDEDDYLYEVWLDVSNGAEGLFRRMLNSHIAHDIRQMMYHTVTKHTKNVIKLRRSVYLFPAGMGDFVDKMARLYDDIDEHWKSTGEPVAIRTFEVLDADDKQDWIQHQVRESITDNLGSILDSAFEEFDEGEAASQVVKNIKESMGDSIDTAGTYNALLEAEISVEEVLAQQKAEIADSDKQDIIDRVMEQADIEEFDGDDSDDK
jgi:hypothetical protein